MPTRNLNTNLKITSSIELEGILYDGNSSAGTSGQVLSSTSTGTDWVTLSEISGVDGSGTANYLSKWLDANTITNSLVYDNGTNVGIGTNNPQSKLEVHGQLKIESSVDDMLHLNATDSGPIYIAFDRASDRHAYVGFGGTSDSFEIKNEESAGDISYSALNFQRFISDN